MTYKTISVLNSYYHQPALFLQCRYLHFLFFSEYYQAQQNFLCLVPGWIHCKQFDTVLTFHLCNTAICESYISQQCFEDCSIFLFLQLKNVLSLGNVSPAFFTVWPRGYQFWGIIFLCFVSTKMVVLPIHRSGWIIQINKILLFFLYAFFVDGVSRLLLLFPVAV